MDLTDITLKQIPEAELAKMVAYWQATNPSGMRLAAPVRIVKPLEYLDHETLLGEFMDHP